MASMLSLDVLGLIIEHLSCEDGGQESVRICCLANRDFAHICQNLLFSSTKITQRRLSASEHQIPHPIVRFQEFIERNPSLSSYIRTLELGSMIEYDCADGFKALEYLRHVHTFKFGFCDTDDWGYGTPRRWSTVPALAVQTLLSFIQRNPITTLVLFGIKHLSISFFQHFRVLEDLLVMNVSPEGSPISPCMVPPPRLKRLTCKEGTSAFAEACILGAGVLDISNLTHLSMDFGMLDYTNVFLRLLPLPEHLHSLELALQKSFKAWTCRGHILSKLLPTSRETLTSLKIEMRVHDTEMLPPYGDLLYELEGISGCNVLETLEILVLISFESTADLSPTKWNQLDTVLSNGFPYLRKLYIYAYVDIGYIANAWEEAEEIEQEINAIFDENYQWSKKHLDFTWLGESGVV